MKRFKMTTCLVLAMLLAFTCTAAFAGTKYSNAVGFGKVFVRPTPTPAPTEEPDDYYFERDASGNLVLDSDGDPVVYIPDGFKVPTGFQRDENGKLVLDGNGDPIMLFGEIAPVITPAPEATEEPAPEVTEEPAPEVTEEPAPEVTEEPAPEVTEEPAPEVTEEPAAEPEVEPEVKPEAKPEVKPEAKPEEKSAEEPMPTVPTEEVIEEAPVALGNADVRLEADGLSEIFITLPEGTALVVLAVEGDWIKVDVDGQIGYIYKDSVKGLEVKEPETSKDSANADEPQEPEKKVTIFSSRRTVMAPGEIVYLTSKLEGLDGYTVTYQWQYDRGNGYEDIPGANADTYSYEASIETLNYGWRLLVYFE